MPKIRHAVPRMTPTTSMKICGLRFKLCLKKNAARPVPYATFHSSILQEQQKIMLLHNLKKKYAGASGTHTGGTSVHPVSLENGCSSHSRVVTNYSQNYGVIHKWRYDPRLTQGQRGIVTNPLRFPSEPIKTKNKFLLRSFTPPSKTASIGAPAKPSASPNPGGSSKYLFRGYLQLFNQSSLSVAAEVVFWIFSV